MKIATDFINCNRIPLISISFHPEKSLKVKTFRPREVKNLENLADWARHYVYSPIVYTGDKRKKENFLSADFVGLDIDDGLTLNDARDIIKEQQIACILGTTMSHQKSKDGKPPTDRFRIIIKMNGPIFDCDRFEYNVRCWIKVFSADNVAKDGARIFRPINNIEIFEGLEQDWLSLPKNYLNDEKRAAQRAEQSNFYTHRGSIPDWILHAVRFGVPKGGGGIKGRHTTCYRIAATLAELGRSEDEICDFICSGPLIEIGERDVRHQVRYGFERGRKSIVANGVGEQIQKSGS